MKKVYSVENMHCAACKANVEKALLNKKGVIKCEANLITNSVNIDFNDKEIKEEEIIKIEKSAGYTLNPIEDDVYIKKENYTLKIVKIILGVLLLVPLMYFAMAGMGNVPDFLMHPIYLSGIIQLILSVAIIGIFFEFYKVGFLALIKLRPNMESLVFLGSVFSFIYSIYLFIMVIINGGHGEHAYPHYYFDTSAMILVVVYIGKFIETLSKRKANSTIEELLKLRPKTAKILRNGAIHEIETKYIKPNDILVVNPGDTIPADGIIATGSTSVDESLVTGESKLVLKKEDDEVIGGTINKEGSIQVIVTHTNKDSTLEKIVSLVSEASNMKSKTTKMVDKVSLFFVPSILGIATLTFIIWFLLDMFYFKKSTFNSFDEAFMYFSSVLVVACPCALGLATPISLLVGSSVFSKNGILVNKSEAIEKISTIDTLVLDKTNTITHGELEVIDITYLKDEELSKNIIFTLEKYSSHPLAKSICKYLENDGKLIKELRSARLLPGKGVFGKLNEEEFYIGNIKFLEETIKDKDYSKYYRSDLETLFMFTKNELYSVIYLKDKLSEDAIKFVSLAHKYFKEVILLTGDNKDIAEAIAKEVGVTRCISEVTPEEKDNVIKSLQEEGKKVMMVGDGVNDSIALTRSDIGIGIAKGSDIALSSSDFILMSSNVLDILSILKISKRINNNIKFNLLWAFIYNLISIPIAAGIFNTLGFSLNPMICSALMALSSITVCLNALTLFIYKKEGRL